MQARQIYEFGPFRFDLAEHKLQRNDEVLKLTPKALQTLALLIQNSGHLVGKHELIDRIWSDSVVEDCNLNVIIHMLRKALGDDPASSKYIETVSKRGYRFVAAVRRVSDQESLRNESAARLEPSLPDPYHTPSTTITVPSSDRDALARGLFRAKPVLRSLALAVLALAILAGLFLAWRLNARKNVASASTAATTAPVKSIAVLPFTVLSSEKGDEYLSLGLADALITSLSQTRQVVVRQTETVTKYAGKERDPLEAGREQNVEAVLDGQVQRIGERVRVTARLVRTSDGASLWAGHFDEQFTHIFAVEDVIAEKVAATVIQTMAGKNAEADSKRLTRRYTDNNEAYQAYLKGRYLWNKRTVDSLKRALDYFQQATRLDPNYALAYVGLADTYTLLSFFTIDAPKDTFPKAKAAAEKALSIDSSLAEAYTALGQVKSYYDWDWYGAEEEFQKGISLNPNYPLLHHWRSLNLIAMGRLDEAAVAMQRALELDPLLLITNVNVGRIDYYAGRYDQAIEKYRRAIELDENFSRGHLRLGMAYTEKGRYQEALAEYYKAREISGETPQVDAHIAHLFAVSGKTSQARAALAKLQKTAEREYVPPYSIALIYCGLGETDEAMKWLEKAYADHSTEMIYFKVDPMLAPLRADARYQALLRRMRLA